jgi:hypothetical protein
MSKELMIAKGGSVMLWHKPTLMQRIFGRRRVYDYNMATLTHTATTPDVLVEEASEYGKVWSYVVLSPKQDYTMIELEQLTLFGKLYLTIKDIINMIRPSTFKSGECIYDILDNKYYKIISVGDTRVRDGAEN